MQKLTPEEKEKRSKNLKPQSQRTKSEQREIAKKGGVASGKVRRERKKFKELFAIAMQQVNPDTGEPNDESIVAGMIKAAVEGSAPAFVAIRDTLGEKPVDKAENKIEGGINIKWGE